MLRYIYVMRNSSNSRARQVENSLTLKSKSRIFLALIVFIGHINFVNLVFVACT